VLEDSVLSSWQRLRLPGILQGQLSAPESTLLLF